jgi:signal transduction histidine kinase
VRLRLRQIARNLGARFDERLAERTRIAREFHDTLLQTIQASKMVADDAMSEPGDPVRARRSLEQLSDWLGRAVEEGRQAVNSLRTSATAENDLARALRLAAEHSGKPDSMAFSLSVDGTPREMHPIVRDEIYRIGYEAIRNACAHSGASRLDVELRYKRDLTLRIKDNGTGIAGDIVRSGRDGHFGLTGMRERAARIGATFHMTTSAATGTEITLVVPSSALAGRRGAES